MRKHNELRDILTKRVARTLENLPEVEKTTIYEDNKIKVDTIDGEFTITVNRRRDSTYP